MPTLRFYFQDQILFEHHMRLSAIRVGRADSCDISLPGEGVSRQHFKIFRRNSSWIIEDTSKHGTKVNGNIIQKQELQYNDFIQIQQYQIEFLEETMESSPTQDDLIAISADRVVVADSECIVEEGFLEILGGESSKILLRVEGKKSTIGKKGSKLQLNDQNALVDHANVYMSYGRLMIEPNQGPVYLNNMPIHTVTPVYPQDEIQIATTSLRMVVQQSLLTDSVGEFGIMKSSVPVMQKLFARLHKFAGHNFPVLLLGESGVGKELVARSLHMSSIRSSSPYIAINCASIPENLIESELFGYEKGAFTGAGQRKDGAFQQADGGTLFLDELGEISLAAQSKLLRTLDSGEVKRVGGIGVEYPDVRIIAATNKNLLQMVEEGTFRKDLLFRLSVLLAEIPPLRERKGDIKDLAHQILSQSKRNYSIDEGVWDILLQHQWSGNVRELRNVLQRALVLSGGHIQQEHIQFFTLEDLKQATFISLTKDEQQEMRLRRDLDEKGGNVSALAREYGVARSTLVYRLRRFNLID